jgi:hypothetical protein
MIVAIVFQMASGGVLRGLIDKVDVAMRCVQCNCRNVAIVAVGRTTVSTTLFSIVKRGPTEIDIVFNTPASLVLLHSRSSKHYGFPVSPYSSKHS